jgi:hypothetical protein
MTNNRDEKIEAVISSLDGMQRAEANPFLYGKIRNRMKGKVLVPKQLGWSMVIALLVVAAVNLSTIFHLNAEKQKRAGADLVAKEYSIYLPQAY